MSAGTTALLDSSWGDTRHTTLCSVIPGVRLYVDPRVEGILAIRTLIFSSQIFSSHMLCTLAGNALTDRVLISFFKSYIAVRSVAVLYRYIIGKSI
jgi:hypothetical protein